MSRRTAKFSNEAAEVIRALVKEVNAHADDYHHKTGAEVLRRAEEFLGRLELQWRRQIRVEG